MKIDGLDVISFQYAFAIDLTTAIELAQKATEFDIQYLKKYMPNISMLDFDAQVKEIERVKEAGRKAYEAELPYIEAREALDNIKREACNLLSPLLDFINKLLIKFNKNKNPTGSKPEGQ